MTLCKKTLCSGLDIHHEISGYRFGDARKVDDDALCSDGLHERGAHVEHDAAGALRVLVRAGLNVDAQHAPELLLEDARHELRRHHSVKRADERFAAAARTGGHVAARRAYKNYLVDWCEKNYVITRRKLLLIQVKRVT